MPTSLRTTRDVVKVVDALDIKRHVAQTFDECKVSPRVMNFWKIYNFAIINKAHKRIHNEVDSRKFNLVCLMYHGSRTEHFFLSNKTTIQRKTRLLGRDAEVKI